MPLMKKKPFKPEPLPSDLRPDEEVFFCSQTNEIFRDYEQFYDRTILLNSLIWSCAVTGKSGFTFDEARECEEKALDGLQTFPEVLERPVLFLVQQTCRGRIDDVVSDVFAFIKNRFFTGEVVDYSKHNNRTACRVVNVQYVGPSSGFAHDDDFVNTPTTSSSGVLNGASKKKGGDNDESIMAPKAELYKYEVEHIDDEKHITCDFDDLHRCRKGMPTKPRLKLFIKQNCEVPEGQQKWRVKPQRVQQLDLNNVDFADFLAGPLPVFQKTPALRKGPKEKAKRSPQAPDTSAKKRKKNNDTSSKRRKNSALEAARQFASAIADAVHESAKDGKSVPRRSAVEVEELKRKQREQRIKERLHMREQREIQRKLLFEWKRPRDDLLCDDLKPLPDFKIVELPENIPGGVLGDSFYVLEFLNSFGDLIKAEESFASSSFNLDVMFQVLLSRDVGGVFFNVTKCLLDALFDMQEQEDGDEADLNDKSETQEAGELENRLYSTAIRDATLESERVRQIYGVSVRNLPVNEHTITEAVRLYIAASGYFIGGTSARVRFTHRGGYRCWDDRGLVFKTDEQNILEKLRTRNLFDLTPAERLRLLKFFVDQLLTYSPYRERIDEVAEKYRLRRWNLKQLQCAEARNERESQTAKQRLELKSVEEQLKAEGDESNRPEPVSTEDALEREKEHARAQKILQAELERFRRPLGTREASKKQPPPERSLLNDINFDVLTADEIESVRIMQRERFCVEEAALVDEIIDLQTQSGAVLLGQDRAFRRYWMLRCVPGVLVEWRNEREIGECGEATPVEKVEDVDGEKDVDELRWRLYACSGTEKCRVHNDGERESVWRFVGDKQQLSSLLDACNRRGFRESELAEMLRFCRRRLEKMIENCTLSWYASTAYAQELRRTLKASKSDEEATRVYELSVRDLLLEVEEKIFFGLLGSLKVKDRNSWRDAIEHSRYDPQCAGVEHERVRFTAEELRRESCVRQLAVALLQVAQGIDVRFFKKPFVGEEVSTGAKKQQNGGDDVDEHLQVDEPGQFQRWKNSLLESTSYSQVYLHLLMLERNVQWSKSRLNMKCRVCRRKGDQTSLALCSTCDNAYHIYCLKPELKRVPDGEWQCVDCRPKERKTRKVASKTVEPEPPAINGRSKRSNHVFDVDDVFTTDDNSEDEAFAGWQEMCARCGGQITDKARVDCSSCNGVYHLRCTNLRSKRRADDWTCAECASSSSE